MSAPTMEQIIAAVEADKNTGFCVECGNEQDGVEPDARRHRCDNCGKRTVFGAQELLLAGGF